MCALCRFVRFVSRKQKERRKEMTGQVVDFYEIPFMVISENRDKRGQDKVKVTTGSSFSMYIISSKQTVP